MSQIFAKISYDKKTLSILVVDNNGVVRQKICRDIAQVVSFYFLAIKNIKEICNGETDFQVVECPSCTVRDLTHFIPDRCPICGRSLAEERRVQYFLAHRSPAKVQPKKTDIISWMN